MSILDEHRLKLHLRLEVAPKPAAVLGAILGDDVAADALIAKRVTELRALQPRFEEAASRYSDAVADLEKQDKSATLIYNPDYCANAVFWNALVKLRLMLEQNFQFIETLGLLAVTRYVFEALVWLRSIDKNPDYGLVFVRRSIDDEIKHIRGHKAKIESEIVLFEELEKEQARLFQEALAATAEGQPHKHGLSTAGATEIKKFVEIEIDRRARRSFSIYGEGAKTNGYGFQGHLLRTQVMQQIETDLAKRVNELAAYDANCPPQVVQLAKQKQNWEQQARSVDMEKQYDFLYRYTSRLLHASPPSIFTSQKNLEPREMAVFLEFVYVSFLDALELAERRIGMMPKHN